MAPRRLAILAALLLLLLLAWSVAVEPRWVAVRRIDHRVTGWQGPPLRVAVASDWHFTKRPAWRVMSVERAQQLVDEINAAAPDVILLLGDFISDRHYRATLAPTAEEEIALVLGRLRAPLGVHAVLGNHDWWHDGPRFAAALQARGIRVLENDARAIDAGVWLAGIGDHSTGHSRPRTAIAKIPAQAFTLVMMHDPASLFDLPPLHGLALAGHTHGGQVYLPFLGAPLVPGAAPRRWAYGWLDNPGIPARVTSGLGVSMLPVRLNMRPEWLLITIDAALG